MNENSQTDKTNRLINEKSPYLLQHAHNPVNWYPWGNEAFAKAATNEKPIFLSIGYSTCHWCHVMERESFENEELASILNTHFIAMKVDREERPDIDNIYMQVCQALTGSGGWPLTIIMTPERQPFYAATYLPLHSRGGMLGLTELLTQLAGMWEMDRDKAVQAGREVTRAIKRMSTNQIKQPISNEIFSNAFQQYQKTFDRDFGGFGAAPKFPMPHALTFLLKYSESNNEPKALDMVEKTLESMYKGGIYDHIGFGFARYSTDRRWLVPHFEKMLYDNALLVIAYAEAFQLTGKELYRQVAEDTLDYILRDMTSPEGGFYSAEDADSEGEEGKFYTWNRDEVVEVLGDRAKSFCDVYDITENGNFEGRSLPNLIAQNLDDDPRHKFEPERQNLFQIRAKRIKPFKDDKILTGWNGLMIAAMAIAYGNFKDARYLQAAAKAADFIGDQLRREDGRLLARYREGEACYPAYASDYAFLIWGLIELYEAGGDQSYLEKAIRLNNELIELFYDHDDGGLFFYGADSEQLLTRPKEFYDGSVPSDNAVATYNFLRLSRLTGDQSLDAKAQQQFEHFASIINQNPTVGSFWLQAALYQRTGARKIVLVQQT
jgi:uncharacterized protein